VFAASEIILEKTCLVEMLCLKLSILNIITVELNVVGDIGLKSFGKHRAQPRCVAFVTDMI